MLQTYLVPPSCVYIYIYIYMQTKLAAASPSLYIYIHMCVTECLFHSVVGILLNLVPLSGDGPHLRSFTTLKKEIDMKTGHNLGEEFESIKKDAEGQCLGPTLNQNDEQHMYSLPTFMMMIAGMMMFVHVNTYHRRTIIKHICCSFGGETEVQHEMGNPASGIFSSTHPQAHSRKHISGGCAGVIILTQESQHGCFLLALRG